MKIFDVFKKKKKKPEKKIKKKEIKEKPIKREAEVKIKPEKKVEERPLPSAGVGAEHKKKRVSDKAYRVLYSPHIAEKATGLEKENKYVFKILPKANKIEIKEAVESAYGVDVVEVSVINISRKRRRMGRYTGWKKGYKKAIVKVKKGQKIEILSR